MMREKYAEQRGIYLLSHSIGLPLKQSQADADDAYWRAWRQADTDIWPQWFSGIDNFRHQLSELLQTQTKNICPQTNISSAVGKVIFSLPATASKKVILLCEDDFPSIGYALQQSHHIGYQLRYLPKDADLHDVATWEQHLTGDVGLCLITHVQSNTGRRLPVAQITEIARQRSILSLVDIAQSVGIVPINITQWQADFIVGSCVKWLSGGPGAGFLWVDSAMIERCEPRDVGWFSHQAPFEFDIHEFRYAEDALRFWGGTPSVHPFLVAASSLQFVNSVGIAHIEANNVALSSCILEQIKPEYLVSPRAHHQRGGTLILHFGDHHTAVTESLERHAVQFDGRAKGIRLSPHLCNSPAQIAHLLDILESAQLGV
ncbi:MAG: aminotransferase class V-fold PLP-dependent enzyme [Porticoccaceae bacterium]|nr:aminotransferase class V-fold PLP-dependent enzyme [Porticoccaceae bacterium]